MGEEVVPQDPNTGSLNREPAFALLFALPQALFGPRPFNNYDTAGSKRFPISKKFAICPI